MSAANNPQQAFQNFRDDPDVKRALAQIDKEQFHNAMCKCMASLTTEHNFMHYTDSLQRLKRRFSKLPEDVEAEYKGRAEQRFAACTSFTSSADQISQMFQASGFDQVLSRNPKGFFAGLQVPPNDTDFADRLTDLGARDDDIAHYNAWLRANDWNPLNLPDAGGTFAGLVNLAKNRIPSLQNERDAARNDGVPAIQGASNAMSAIITAVIAVGFVACAAAWIPCAITLAAA